MKSKRLLLMLLIALIAPWAANAQNLNEGFESTTFPPTDWNAIHVSGSNSWARYTSYKHNGDASAYAHWASSGHENYLITPKLVPARGESLSFFVSAQSYSGTTLKIELSTTTATAAAFTTTLATYTTGSYSSNYIGTTSPSTFVEKTIDLSDYDGQQIYIAFHVIDSNGGDVIIDDVTGVTLYVPTCVKPTLGEAQYVTEEGASFQWTENGSATNWVLEYSTNQNFTNATSVPRSDIPSLAITGLTPGTTYYAHLKSNCGGGDESDWSNTVSFTTLCDVINAEGYSENFDSYTGESNYTAASRVMPNCWNYINECTYSSYKFYPTVSSYSPSSYANSTPNYLKFYSVYSSYTNYDPQPQYAILPEMTGLAGKQVSLKVKGYSSSSTFKVGTMSDPTDASTFVEITNSSNPSVSSSYQEFTYIIPANTTTRYLAIMMEAANSSTTTKGIYIDDIVITEAPSCFQPQSLAVTEGSLTAHEATLTWTPNVNGNETAWVLQVATKNDFSENLQSFDVNTTPSKAITELTDGTQYFARVKPDCDTEGTLWSTTYTFTTPIACPAPTGLAVSNTTGSQTTLNWTGNSDSYDVVYRTAAYVDGLSEGFSSSLPEGWENKTGLLSDIMGGTALSDSYQWYFGNNNGVFDYHARINIYGASRYGWLITPEINVGNGFGLSFDLALTAFSGTGAASGTCDDDRFVVLVTTDNEATWTILREWNNEDGATYVYNNIPTAGTNVSIDFSSYVGQNVRIAFYGESTVSGNGDNNLHIDNVLCGIPHEAGQWITHNQEPVTGTTYTLDGLSPETDYEVKVLSNCDGETSHETAAVSFTTEAACMVPNTVTYTNVTAHTAQLSWNSDASAWEICVNGDEANPVPANTNTNFELTGLTDGETYTAKVRAVCNGTPGDWSSEVSFTTPIACPAPTGLAVSGTTGSQTTLNWTGESDSYEVYYGEEELVTVADADFETGDFSQASFTNSTTYPWTVVENAGAHYAKSAGGFTSTQSDLTLQVVGPGTVQFRAKVSSESGYDYGRFLINGTQKVNVSGAGSWIDYEFELAAGNNTLVWRYYKDVSTDSNDDCFYVDDINITGMVVNTWNLHGTTDELTYTLDGLDPETDYQVKVKSACTNETGHETAAVSFTTEAACMVPNELAAVPAATTANLSWTSDASAWQISTGDDTNPISLTSETTGVTINGTTVSYTLTGLTPATTYTVKVRSVCNGTPSEWSETMSFTTECEAQTITAATPFTEGFEGITDTHVYSETNGIIPTCWDSYSEGSVYPHIINSGSYYYVHGGTGTMYFKGEASTNSYLALPIFTNDLSTLIVSFWMQTENASSGTLSLGYITNADVNYNTYQVIKTYDNTTTMKQCQTYLGSNTIPSNAARLVFRWQYTGTSWYGACIDDVTVEIAPTFTKDIDGYHGNAGGYYLIASPLNEAITPTNVGGMITDNFDLFRYNQGAVYEWENYLTHTDDFVIEPGKGYLYASAEDTQLVFTGVPYNGNGEVTLTVADEGEGLDFPGFNLVGNPLDREAYINREYYAMKSDGTGLELIENFSTRTIGIMEGIFVEAASNDDVLTFTTEAPNNGKGIVLNLSQRCGIVDRAIVRYGQSPTLHKFMLNQDDTKLYIPENGEDFAVVCKRNSGEVLVNFEPAENGIYTISVDVRNMNLSSLVLKDYVKNVTVDLLRTPNYMFKANTNDRADRFALSFRTSNNIYKEKVVKGANSDDFGFFSNGNWIIDNEGEATLQVIDLNGRVLSSENIYGSTSIQVDAAPGVYMLRLINGNDVKTQKVVVE